MFKSKMFLGLTALGMSALIAFGGTFAWFTSSANLPSSNFNTGTLTIKLSGNAGATTLDLTSADKIMPGDVMPGTASVTIENTGSSNLAWFGQLVFNGPDALKDYLFIDSMQMEFLTPTSQTWEPTDQFITNGTGSGPYPAWYTSLVDSNIGKISLRKLMGNAGMNALGYENMGALKPGYKYRLTFKIGLAGKTPDTLQGQPANISYSVKSTQIKVEALNALITGAGSHYSWFNDQIANQIEA